MFKKILLTFFLLIFPFFTYAETGDILSGTGLDNNSFSSKDLFSETGVTENAFSGKIEDIFDTSFNIIFQNPSYILDKDLTKEEYICDEKKDECKVNFKLVTPAGKKLSSKLSCEIDFGFDSDQSLKCNPNTVVFPVGNNKVFFKVSQKDKLENFTLKNILIRNQSNQQNSGSGTLVEEETGSGTLDEESNTGSGALVEEETGSGETIEEENSGSGTLVELTVPEVFIEVQSGLEYSGSGELWTCKKEDCKVNLTAEDIFTGSFEESKYQCLWSFSGGTYNTGTTQKCNPGYVSYGLGEYKIELKVFEKGNPQNFKENYIFVENIKIEDEEEETGSGGVDEENTGSGTLDEEETGSGETIEEENSGSGILLTIPEVFIEVQSGLEYSGTGKLWTCKKEDCKVNLTAEDIFTGSFEESKYQCLWSFSGGTYSSGTTQKCNPGYVSYGLGEYKIELKVFEKGNPQDFKENHIFVENIKIDDEEEQNSGSGGVDEENTGSGETIEEENSGSGVLLTVPEVFIEVQSGLEYSGSGELWTCKKEDCKVNLTVEDIFTGSFEESKYQCLWSFPGGIYNTGTTQKCNPGYVSYGLGEYKIELKVFEKGNPQNFKENYIFVKNIKIDDEEENTGSGALDENNSGSGTLDEEQNNGGGGVDEENSGSGTLVELTVPEVFIEVQSGLEYSGTGELWTCKKEDCKVNLTAENIFTGSFEKSKYQCLWSFSGGTYSSGTTQKCNPGYVSYGLGEYKIELKVFEKLNPQNFKENYIFVENIKKKRVIGGSSISKKVKIKETKFIKEIIIQSGLNLERGRFICNEQKCKVNFKYNKSSKDVCLWDFGGGDFKEKYLHTCNPGVIYFGPGDYKIKLKVTQSNKLLGEKSLEFSNIYQSYNQKTNTNPVAEISLQGVVGKTKVLSGNLLKCNLVDKCSVNLTGEESYDLDKNDLAYRWDFGNGEFSDKKNPSSIWYSPGKYTISLEVSDGVGGIDKKEFFVEVIPKPKKEKDIIKEKKDLVDSEEKNLEKDMFLLITKVLPNPKGVDNNERIELKNIGEYPINIKGLIIDDILEKGSKQYKVKKDIILQYNQTYRFYKFDTKLNLNNAGDEVNLIYNNKVLDSISWNFSVRDNYILTHKNLEIKRQEVFVDKVIDGDTLLIRLESGELEKLRLIGVDTPEIKHPRKKVELYGKKASLFTKRYLEGKTVILETDIQNYRDKYGRLLGYVFIKEKNKEIFFNKLLIETGNARGYYKFDFKYIKDFEKVEKIAKKNLLGLWQDKEVKKIFLKETRVDKKALEQTLKSIEQDNKLFVDLDKNNIPDEFEEYEFKTIKKDDKSITIATFSKKIKDYNAYSDFIQKSFIIKTSFLKSGLKLTGKTLPNTPLTIWLGDLEVNLVSDNNGNFIYIFDSLKAGVFYLKVRVTDTFGNTFFIENIPDVKIKKDYVLGIIKRAEEKRIKRINKQKKKYKRKLKKQKSSKEKKQANKDNILLEINKINKEEKQESSIPFLFIILLTVMFFVLGLFVLLKKGGIFSTQNLLSIIKNEYKEKIFLIIE